MVLLLGYSAVESKWRPEPFEHWEVSNVEGRQLKSFNVSSCGNEIVAQSNTAVTAAVSAHHFTGTTGDELGRRFGVKRCEQPPDFSALDRAHAADDLGD